MDDENMKFRCRTLLLLACTTLLLGPLVTLAEPGDGPREAGPRAPMADLRVVAGSFSYAPASPTVGEEVQLNVTMENVGNADCESGFDVEFFLNDTAHPFKPGENEIEFPPLPKNNAWNVTQWWGTNDLASGINYTILIVLDIQNEVNESDETNNHFTVNLSLGPRLYPELYIPPGGVWVHPSRPLVGDNVTITATVSNDGEKTAKFVDVFFYVNDTAHQIGGYQTIGSVNVSEAKNASCVWNTAGLSAGNYTILVMVNPSWDWNHIPERDSTDNNASMNVTLEMPRADLFLRNVSHLPLKPLIGQGVAVTGEVVNAGNGPSELCNLSLFLDFNVTPVATVAIPSLGPGGFQGFVLSWNSSGLSAALHRIRLVVDPDYRIPDANQTNNTLTWSMEFEGVVDLMLANLTVSPSSPRPGDTVHFSVTVVNAGTLRCNSANLTLRIGGAETDRKQLMTLSAGGQLSSSLRWSAAGMVPGSYDYEVMVAPGPGENDSDTDNNLLAGQLVVQPATPMPDLRVASMTLVPSGPVHNGDTILVVVSVQNAGDLDANGSFLDMKLETANGGIINFTDSPMVVPAIPAGGFATVNISRDTQNYMAGNYSLKAAADFRGDLAESNESNNMMLLELRILEALPKLPRLAVEELILEGKVEQDQKLNIFVVINNTGEADAMNVLVNFIIDGKVQGSAASIPVISRQSNRTASCLWVPAAGKHTIGVTVSAEGVGEQSVSRSVTVSTAPSVANPYMLAAGIGIIAVVLGAVIFRAIGSSRRPMPRLRLIEEEDSGDEGDAAGDDGEGTGREA
jgi:subtilase family serine protease